MVPIFQKNEPTTRKHARWCSLFRHLQVDVIYQPGKANVIADVLSLIKRMENVIIDILFYNLIQLIYSDTRCNVYSIHLDCSIPLRLLKSIRNVEVWNTSS